MAVDLGTWAQRFHGPGKCPANGGRSAPTTRLAPQATSSVHSVSSRTVMHRLPRKNASFWTPPESVTTNSRALDIPEHGEIGDRFQRADAAAEAMPWLPASFRVRG